MSNHNYINTYINKKENKINEYKHPIKCHDNYKQWLPPRTFYRGESKIYGKTSNVAGVYRFNCQESSLYHNYMSRFPKKFNNMNNFSKLTYMQHFGLPTCLLDITSNFLVALYFACCNIFRDSNNDPINNKDLDGRVWLILPRLPKSQSSNNRSLYYTIYNNYSDIIDILSSLAILKTPAQHSVFDSIQKFNNNYTYSHRVSFFRSISHGNNNIIKNPEYSEMYINYRKLMDSYSFRRLFHNINQNNNDFQSEIDFNHIFKPRIVQPAINNQRIKAQQGYFILENYRSNNRKKNSQNILSKEHTISNDIRDNFHLTCIRIPNINKAKVLKELDISYGINKAKLFPDYENVAQYVKEEFKYL